VRHTTQTDSQKMFQTFNGESTGSTKIKGQKCKATVLYEVKCWAIIFINQ